MGENEQGGMLRTVVVVGLVAMVALIMTLGVVGLKAEMSSNTDKTVGSVVRIRIPKTTDDPHVNWESYDTTVSKHSGWGANITYFPIVGDIPNNYWRDAQFVLRANKRVYVRVDVNTYFKDYAGEGNDHDDVAKRSMTIYDDKGSVVLPTGEPNRTFWLEPNRDYTLQVRYFNDSGQTLIEKYNSTMWYYNTAIFSGTSDGSAYSLTLKDFEAATYDAKYATK